MKGALFLILQAYISVVALAQHEIKKRVEESKAGVGTILAIVVPCIILGLIPVYFLCAKKPKTDDDKPADEEAGAKAGESKPEEKKEEAKPEEKKEEKPAAGEGGEDGTLKSPKKKTSSATLTTGKKMSSSSMDMKKKKSIHSTHLDDGMSSGPGRKSKKSSVISTQA